MTSKITNIYDNLGTLAAGALTGYKRLPNPYILEANNDLFLAKGFAVAIGDGQAENLSIGSIRGRSRTFSVILTNQVTSTDHDATGRETLEKALAEDLITLENAVERDNTLSGKALKVDYVSDSGVGFLAKDGGRSRFLVITINFLVLYQETLS